MRKTIEISLLSLLGILFGCNDDSYGEKISLYESVFIEYRVKEVIALEDPVFIGIYDNKDHSSPIVYMYLSKEKLCISRSSISQKYL